jgi:hypothetical protein
MRWKKELRDGMAELAKNQVLLVAQMAHYERIVTSLLEDRQKLLDRLMARDLPEFAQFQSASLLKPEKLEELSPDADELSAGEIVEGV